MLPSRIMSFWSGSFHIVLVLSLAKGMGTKLMFLLQSLIIFLSISLFPLLVLTQVCDSGLGYCDSEDDLPSKILIKGGTVVNADHQEVADVYVEDGVIVVVRANIKVGDGVRVVDATGKFVMPGGIDPHTHLAM